MGRKTNWAEKPKSGPGRKARKQPAPAFPGLGISAQDSGINKNKNKRDFIKKKKATRKFGDPTIRAKPGQPFVKSGSDKPVRKGKIMMMHFLRNYSYFIVIEGLQKYN